MKNDKEEYRTIYIGGSRNFLLIKYADSKKEYPYMVYIDYEKAEGWKWSVKCRNIMSFMTCMAIQSKDV